MESSLLNPKKFHETYSIHRNHDHVWVSDQEMNCELFAFFIKFINRK